MTTSLGLPAPRNIPPLRAGGLAGAGIRVEVGLPSGEVVDSMANDHVYHSKPLILAIHARIDLLAAFRPTSMIVVTNADFKTKKCSFVAQN